MENKTKKRNDLIELIKTKKELLCLIYEFNRIPASYAHSSWIEPLIPFNLFSRIQKSRSGMLKISNLMLKHNHLDETFYYDFYDAKNRLALLPGDVLRTLTFYGGIALNHKAIKTVIDKKERRVIIDNIGEQGYRFAFDRAPLLIGTIENKLNYEKQLEHFSDFIQECGTRLFLSAFVNGPEALYKRVLLKFKKDIAPEGSLKDYENDPLKIWTFFIRIMKQVVDRQWQKFVL